MELRYFIFFFSPTETCIIKRFHSKPMYVMQKEDGRSVIRSHGNPSSSKILLILLKFYAYLVSVLLQGELWERSCKGKQQSSSNSSKCHPSKFYPYTMYDHHHDDGLWVWYPPSWSWLYPLRCSCRTLTNMWSSTQAIMGPMPMYWMILHLVVLTLP